MISKSWWKRPFYKANYETKKKAYFVEALDNLSSVIFKMVTDMASGWILKYTYP